MSTRENIRLIARTPFRTYGFGQLISNLSSRVEEKHLPSTISLIMRLLRLLLRC